MPPKKTLAKKAASASSSGKTKAKAKATVLCGGLSDAIFKNLVKEYTKLIESSKPWKWSDIKTPSGAPISKAQISKIRQYARINKLVTVADKDPVQTYGSVSNPSPPFIIFPAKYIKDSQILPVHLRTATDSVQFTYLNNALKASNPNYDPVTQTFTNDPKGKKYTWHHVQAPPGQMELVETGVHNLNKHTGGRNVWGGGTGAR